MQITGSEFLPVKEDWRDPQKYEMTERAIKGQQNKIVTCIKVD